MRDQHDVPATGRFVPEILAPAGDAEAFLAALAAGADAVYAGLKHFSARMQADNFAVKDLARLCQLCRDKGGKTYLALNTLLKPGDLDAAGRLLDRVARVARPEAVIVQDAAAVNLLRQVGYRGEVHLSTLAAVSPPAGLATAKAMGVDRVVLARECNVDEIRAMHEAAEAADMDLEAFVHGALCFCVSGRCYWSSYMGGKSGLRGRCVQPCRRRYRRGEGHGKPGAKGRDGGRGDDGRVFSCQDLSLDVLAKTLLRYPRVKAWKIEGRKKGPHYVFYAVTAYRMLRDHGDDPAARKEALAILERALGRTGSHGLFLPQKPHQPLDPEGKEEHVASGMLVGRVAMTQEGGAYLSPRIPLLKGDLLRIGSEDDAWHQTIPMRKSLPKGGRLDIQPPRPRRFAPRPVGKPGAGGGKGGANVQASGKPGDKQGDKQGDKTAAKAAPRPRFRPLTSRPAPKGAPVYLIDRREPELASRLHALHGALERVPLPGSTATTFEPTLPTPLVRQGGPGVDLWVRRSPAPGKTRERGVQALWMTPFTPDKLSPTLYSKIWWWLPPIIWPEEEETWKKALHRLVRDGGRRIVCNAPWQLGLLPDLGKVKPVAGPFCNLANALALQEMQSLGFDMAFVSPELGREETLALPRQSPIPVGLVLSGYWPVGVTRYAPPLAPPQEPMSSRPGESFFSRPYGPLRWIYPSWPLDLTPHRQALEDAGYVVFAHLHEPRPRGLEEATRSSQFNWECGVL